jgi:eukaryotic-like serine/threonine-protein kinase
VLTYTHQSFCKNPSPERIWPKRKMASRPAKIGKYNVEGILGRGGMGVVYKAVDSQIGRYVAIKMITAGGDPSLLERFKSEARSTGSLTCPNIVTLFDWGEQDGNPYLVMQFLEGSSLESLIQKGVSLTLSERIGIIIDVCNGLAYAHQRGVIHRDIKPGNIMVLQDGVNDGMAVIVDFGIARIGGDTRLTRTDQLVGSVHYMSAEQLQAKELDNRTDIYSAGVVLFQLLTGALPFDSPDTAATLLKIVNEPPPPLSKYLKEYPVELEAIINKVLAKKREERYASAKDLAFDLMQVQEHLKSEVVAQLLRRAESLVEREDWTRAREQLQQAQRIDRQNTQVQRMVTAVQDRLRQLQRIEQARALRSQADEAYMDQRYDDALRLLDQAVALDGSNSDLLTFRDSVRSAKERATGLRRALRRAEAALQDGDLDEAQSALSEAFKIDPQETQVKALKAIIAQQAEEKVRQEQVRKLLDQARNQIAARNLTAAFTILKNAEALDPASNELQAVVKLAMAAREQEKRRTEIDALCRQIEAALNQEDYATAAAKADEGLRKIPHEQRLLRLRALVDAQRLRVEQKKFVREQFSAANSLANSGQLRQAVAVLERALQRAPGNSELESLRSTFLDRLATEEAEQRRQQAVETTLAEGERILQERGARDAAEFLAAQAVEYSDSPRFRELYDSIREREVLDGLDSRLASAPNPARQLQLAEEALRQNPKNRGLQQRVADLRQLGDQVNAVIARAQGLEAARRFPEAIQQWRQLSATYPQFPEFEAQIRRIENLQAESKKSRASPTGTLEEPQKIDEPRLPKKAIRVSAAVWAGTAIGVLAVVVSVVVLAGRGSQPHPSPPGYVELNPLPWADVVAIKKLGSGNQSVGNFSGQTPMRVSLPPGDYLIQLKGPSGLQEITVSVESGKLARRADVLSGFDADRVVDELVKQK